MELLSAHVGAETVPTGDQRFKKTFEDIFREHHIEYDFTTRIHPATGHNVTYINFEMQLPSLSPNDPTLVLYGLDYVTRHAATNPRDNYKGAGPTADLHKWEHGTFSWLTRHVDRLRRDAVGHVVFMHHHTYSSTPFFIPDYFSMNQTDRVAVKEMIEESPLDISQFWGALVGHMHFWDTQPSLFSTFTQWENSATMSEGANAISLVSIRKGRVHIVERCCGILSPEVEIAVEIAFSLGVAFLQVLVFFFIAKYVQHAQLFSVSPELNIMTGLSESDADLPENSLLSASIFSFATLRSGVGSGVGGESASWFSGRKGWTWIVAVLCMLLSVAIPLIPLNEPQILLGVTASYLNDALLGALAIPLTLLMSLVFGVALKTKLGYVVLGVVWVAVSVLDYLRFFLRSSWTHNEHSYGEFWGPGLIAVLAVLFICFAYVTLRMRKSALELSTVPSFSLSRFLLSIFFMTLPGLTLVLGMAIVPAVIFRILLPIHWGEFYAFTVILVVTLILSVGGTLFFIHQALRVRLSLPLDSLVGVVDSVTLLDPPSSECGHWLLHHGHYRLTSLSIRSRTRPACSYLSLSRVRCSHVIIDSWPPPTLQFTC